MLALFAGPHRRYNPLADEWILVSPHRLQRPWQGQVESSTQAVAPAYDPRCYLCPGNERANGEHNPAYTHTFVFDNDFGALLPQAPDQPPVPLHPLLHAQPVYGRCRVLCYAPEHNRTLADLSSEEMQAVLRAWINEYQSLGADPKISYVQIFENRGALMGASNPHPHGQIWATQHLPTLVQREHTAQGAYYDVHGRTLLSDYLEEELRLRERVIDENDHVVTLVPFWAVWPFETMVVPKRNVAALDLLTNAEQVSFGRALQRLIRAYDRVFSTTFPYSFGFHQQPTDGLSHPEWHVHAHFMPPLLRSATVRKFMVGFELLAEAQRDLTPELAAERLRSLIEMEQEGSHA